jgi:hypothetical protein
MRLDFQPLSYELYFHREGFIWRGGAKCKENNYDSNDAKSEDAAGGARRPFAARSSAAFALVLGFRWRRSCNPPLG